MPVRIRIFVALIALTLAFSVPALAQSGHDHNAAPADTAQPAQPTVDPNKTDLLHQEFVAKTAELRGKLTAKRAELETLLATKPGDEGAVKKLVADIAVLEGTLLEKTTLFRIRMAKETGMPIRMTRNMENMGGAGGMMGGAGGGMCGKGKGMADKTPAPATGAAKTATPPAAETK